MLLVLALTAASRKWGSSSAGLQRINQLVQRDNDDGQRTGAIPR